MDRERRCRRFLFLDQLLLGLLLLAALGASASVEAAVSLHVLRPEKDHRRVPNRPGIRAHDERFSAGKVAGP